MAIFFSGGASDPGIEHASPALAGRFFATEPPGKPYLWDIPKTKLYKKRLWNANIKKTDITIILDKTEFKVNQWKVKENAQSDI